MIAIGENALGDYFGQPLGNQLITAFILVNIIGIIWCRQDDAAIPLFLLWIVGLVFLRCRDVTPGMGKLYLGL